MTGSSRVPEIRVFKVQMGRTSHPSRLFGLLYFEKSSNIGKNLRKSEEKLCSISYYAQPISVDWLRVLPEMPYVRVPDHSITKIHHFDNFLEWHLYNTHLNSRNIISSLCWTRTLKMLSCDVLFCSIGKKIIIISDINLLAFLKLFLHWKRNT